MQNETKNNDSVSLESSVHSSRHESDKQSLDPKATGSTAENSLIPYGEPGPTVTSQEPYPWHIIFILGNEFCERFSYYGMKTVLTLYFLEVLLWTESTTTLVYHLFTVLCYFTPVFGAMLADGWLGKFGTVFWLSIVYVLGLVLLTLSSMPPLKMDAIWGTGCGLVLIGFGTGGIKPVVPAYGGDQFLPGQDKQRERFFSVFYFCINAGSLISTFVTPILRSDVPCFSSEGCYPLAFGLPAILMVVALVAFLAGRSFYRNVSSEFNVIARVIGVCTHAVTNKLRKRGPTAATHWLDYAEDTYTKKFIQDVKQIMPVLKMFLPLPMFWALFDQQGSRWTLQATKMDGRITDDYYWKPDQVQIFNPILILLLVPVFEGAVFPLLDKYRVPFKPLARMTAGMVLAGIAFVLAGLIQLRIDAATRPDPPANTAEMHIFNAAPCAIEIHRMTDSGVPLKHLVEAYGHRAFPALPAHDVRNFSINVQPIDCVQMPKDAVTPDIPLSITERKLHLLTIAMSKGALVYKLVRLDKSEKLKEGKVRARVIAGFSFNTSTGGGSISLISKQGKKGHKSTVYLHTHEGSAIMENVTDVDNGKYLVEYPDEATNGGRKSLDGVLDLPIGGTYVIVLKENSNDSSPWMRYTIVPPNTISVFWQLPQYTVITIGEVLFSVSGLCFAYSQAPTSMKSVLQAGWLLTVAFGNLIVIIISGAELFQDQATEFFVFAGLIGVFAVVFAWMSYLYVYVESRPDKASEDTRKLELAQAETELQ